MLKAAIFGISGYSGEKLAEILFKHPKVLIQYVLVSRKRENPYISKFIPKFAKLTHLSCDYEPDWKEIAKTDLVFLALPHRISMEFVPQILDMGKKIIDLSADFRFTDPQIYEKWYSKHICEHILKEAIYGLPELNRKKIKESRIVANPGCYSTSAILGLLPLTTQKLTAKDIIIDAKSGVTGAGRQPSGELMFSECNENVKAYKIGQHRHCPEIEEVLTATSGESYDILFVPHLIPINQGILSTIYVNLTQNISSEDIQNTYERFYEHEPFVRVMPYGKSPEIKNVLNTNFCDIGIQATENNKLVVVSAIDNLVKGAGGQAVQNMNIMYDFPETEPFYKL